MTAQLKKGFTLIELLIVIAIIGVLAVVVLVAINPVEQLAKTRDSGRISTVTQLGHALEAYYTARDALFPPAAPAWGADLTRSGELSTFPAGIAYTAYGVGNCTENEQPATDSTYCYDWNSTDGALVYSRMESNSQNNKCPGGTPMGFAVFSTADGRGGIVCDTGTILDPWASGTQTYY
ncbi:MAG: type II secretion system protein [Patescibacteria group bacterium]